ncbi:MAG: RNase J family beta-CASP ribonuclease [Candidatus Pacebacteria bacterium]|jgi:ribonuclease J|nr:RNase J family beta-CASP ribonuclease [Candidatus Paceibacterota bacterium]
MNELPKPQTASQRPKHTRPFNARKNQNPTPSQGKPKHGEGHQSRTDNKQSRGSYQYGSNKGGRRPKAVAPTEQNKPTPQKRRTPSIPAPEKGVIRVIPLGGVEEIGKNMTAIEIGNDIIVIDAGMQFKTEDTPGIDYIIPNTTYLEERKDKIRAMIVTHGHLDHIGGIPLVMSRIGNPPLYSRNLSILMMKKRQEEFPHLPALNCQIVEKDSVIYAGEMRIRFFGVTHTVPDSMGIVIETPYGSIVNPGDYKLDHIDGIVSDQEQKEYAFFDKEKVLLLLTDSTNVDNEGFSLPEIKAHQGLENLIKQGTGRIIIAAFASHLTRLIKVVEVAEALGKKVVFDGRSMKTNIEICEQAGLFHPKKGTVIPIEDVDKYPPNKIIIMMTGAQGEEFASLGRVANKTHKKFTIKPGDTIILSASVVPGNEIAVERMKDNLARSGVKIISYRTSEETIHATGHGNQEDIKWLHRKTHPKFFIPIHGNHYRLKLHKELAMSLGMSEENIVVPDNGSIVEIVDNGEKITVRKEKAPASPMMVDGFSVGDEQEVVIRDRQMLAEDGMFVLIATIDSVTGKLRKSPDIISRGFIYLKENQDLLHQVRLIIKKTIEDETRGSNPINFDMVKTTLGDNISKFLFQKTAKRPLVIPVLLNI